MSDQNTIWKKPKFKEGNIPEKPFTGTYKEMKLDYLGKNEPKLALVTEFEEGQKVAIFNGLDKLTDEEPPGYTDIARYLTSIKTQGYEYEIGVSEVNELEGIRCNVPEGTKWKMNFEVQKGKVGGSHEGEEFKKWFVEKIEDVKAKPAGKPKPEAKPAPEGLDEFLVTALENGSKKLSDLWKESGKKWTISQIRDSGLIVEDPTKKEHYKFA